MSHKKGRLFVFKHYIVPVVVSISLLLLTSSCSNLKDNSEISTMQNQLEDANASVRAKESRIRELTEVIDNLTQEVDRITTQNENLEKEIVTYKANIGQDFFNAVLSCETIVFQTTETDYGIIGRLFMEKYGDQLLIASEYYPSNEYAISDFMLIEDPTLYETEFAQPKSVEDGIIFTLDCSYAIKPLEPLSNNSPWWAGNTSEYTEKEGWYKISNVISLKLSKGGYVTFESVGTGL